ncbi:helicase RepA family protein [Roseateles albus]|uniref:Helicase RepA family protein n=1 Tax=Roseateles albus TaxID=2987525 RepID=A0ABT5KAG1_9BURK|nr:helicase RepA family protein [Roseateles albus]MDC8770930.1 helicase RepA family protein [Roseateles albus]
MSWAALDIAKALTGPRPVLDLVLPGLPVGTVGNLVAPGATGKTQFLLQLAVSRCLGLPALGGLFPAAPPENVFFLAAEEQEIVMSQRLHDVTASLVDVGLFPGRSRADIVKALSQRLRVFPLSGQDVYLLSEGSYTEVLARISKLAQGSRLVIADPLRRFHDGDENDSGDMTRLVQGFEQIAKSTKAAVLLAHHTSKAAAMNGSGDAQQAARGSSALTDGVRWQANLSTMPAKTASALGLAAEEAKFLVRFDISKSNYGPPQPSAWLRRLPGGVLTKTRLPEEKATTRRVSTREVQYD